MASKQYILPKLPNPKGQAELILKGAGLAFIKPKFYRVNESEIAKEQGDATTGLSINDITKSKFGLPMFDTFSFSCTVANQIIYKPSKEFGTGDVKLDDPFVFETALITVNQTKNIVKTAISGQNGTVKEFMSEGDFVINLKGVIVGDTANQRPDINQLNSLVAYLKAPVSLPVSCNFLNEWLISSVAVESYTVGQREGARNIIDVEINMLSDSTIELSSTNTKKDIFTQRSMF
jgi:hypothetical protein